MAYRPPWLKKRESKPSSLRLTNQKAHKPAPAPAPDLESELAFPSLGEDFRSKEVETLDFASAANRVDHVPIEDPDDLDTSVPSGWVCMRMKDGKITDRRSTNILSLDPPRVEVDTELVVAEMVNRWQSERDSLNQLLGDMSPYWDSLPIGEELDDD